jgi:NgoBV restriction endonuclease
MSAQKLFDALVQSGLVGAQGHTLFELNGIRTPITDSSVVGNIIQEWLKAFMQAKGIDFRTPDNSQEFPDFFMQSDSQMLGLLEVKCFQKSPNFDVANFLAYCRSLSEFPYRLDADYLIVEYAPNQQGIIIKNIWLKKVWEICSASERAPLKIQWKQNVAFNIRPATWYAKKPTYPVFSDRKAFVLALKAVLDTNSVGGEWQKKWLDTVSKLYVKQTKKTL